MRPLLGAALFLILVSGCGSAGSSPPPPAEGIVTGTVRLSPCRPVERAGDPPCPPAPGVEVRFQPVSGGAPGSAVTDSAGIYSVRLTPGTYQTAVSRGLLRNSARVTVASGDRLSLDLTVDVGIR